MRSATRLWLPPKAHDNGLLFFVNLQVKLTGTLGLYSEAWRTVPSDSSVLILRQHIFWHAWWDTEHRDVREGRDLGKQSDLD